MAIFLSVPNKLCPRCPSPKYSHTRLHRACTHTHTHTLTHSLCVSVLLTHTTQNCFFLLFFLAVLCFFLWILVNYLRSTLYNPIQLYTILYHTTTYLHLFLHGQKQFELRRKLFFRVQAIREVYSANTTVSMQLYSQSFYVVCPVSPSGKVGQVKLNLIPPFVQPHWHRTNERLYTRCRLIVGCSESPPNIFVI